MGLDTSILESVRALLLKQWNNENFTLSLLYRERNELWVIDNPKIRLVLKKFKKPNFINAYIYASIRKSKAKRSFENSQQLIKLGICAPQPVLFHEEISFYKLNKSYYISYYLDYNLTMSIVLHNKKNMDSRARILHAFGEFVSLLHSLGVYHKDLSGGNVLINTEYAKFQFCLVDVNRMKFGLLTDKERFANFKMLWASDEDLRIIMNAYAEAAGIDPTHAYARAVFYSQKHKRRAERKEKIKSWLGLS